jgi:hypothetical protein
MLTLHRDSIFGNESFSRLEAKGQAGIALSKGQRYSFPRFERFDGSPG